MTVTLLDPAPIHTCPASCADARGHICECDCGGDGHALGRKAEEQAGRDRMTARIHRAGGVFNLLPPAPSDNPADWF